MQSICQAHAATTFFSSWSDATIKPYQHCRFPGGKHRSGTIRNPPLEISLASNDYQSVSTKVVYGWTFSLARFDYQTVSTKLADLGTFLEFAKMMFKLRVNLSEHENIKIPRTPADSHRGTVRLKNTKLWSPRLEWYTIVFALCELSGDRIR